MNDHVISAPALKVLEMVRASAVFPWMIQQDSYLLALLIEAAEAAAKSSDRDLARFLEVLARVVCTGNLGVALASNGNGSPALLEEIKRLDAEASFTLGVLIREFVPHAHEIGGAASTPAAN